VTSIELWNYDAAQSFTVTTQTSEGGIIGGNLYMAANSYYAWDVNLRPTDLRIELSGTASSKFQVAINGL
jgi:muramoyltetrapeptide carboxypeptidase LdcA involved in peptidoglycan recycling